MKIDGITYNADVSDIISLLREQLAEYNKFMFTKTLDSGDDVMVQCPYHKNGQERRPSAGIRKSDGLFHCLACGETHSLPEVIGYCFDNNAVFGYKWLSENFGKLAEHTRGTIDLGFDMSKFVSPKYVSEEELDGYRYVHPYMYERGLTDVIIEYFDIGYDKRTDSITFPVRDINGNCLFVARRSVKTKYFDLPKGIEKPLYGLYEITYASKGEYNIPVDIFTTMKGLAKPHIDKVYVCEGLFDCLRLWCNGKVAVAGFGCLYNEHQQFQLESLPTRHLVLAFDNDSAGQSATARLKKQIKSKIITNVILPEGRKDVGECTNDEIQNLKETF